MSEKGAMGTVPLVTVAIPSFNRQHLVGATMESALSQTLTDLEVLVVDDASTDDTRSVVLSRASRDSRLRYVRNEVNLGLTRNWNRCLSLARGEFVNLLLSDDLIDPDYLEAAAGAMRQHPGVGLVATGCRYIDETGAVVSSGNAARERLCKAGDEAVSSFLDGGFPHVSGLVFRRVMVTALGGFREDIWHGPDVELDCRIGANHDVFYIGGIHTSFRRHGANMGVLEYLREDFLEADFRKKELAWGFLSERERVKRGVTDVRAHVTRDVSRAALTGATVTVGLGRRDLSRRYLQRALQLAPSVWRERQFWKVLLLLTMGRAGSKLMARRMKITERDLIGAEAVAVSLARVGRDG